MTILITESAPTFEPVSLDDIKSWLNITDFDDDDFLLLSLIAMASGNIEQRLGHRLASRTVTVGLDHLKDVMRLPLSPVRAVTGITYLDLNGDRQTLGTGYYHAALNKLAPIVVRNELSSFPAHLCQPGSVEITCTVGYADAESVPAPLKHAIAVMVSDHYDNRQTAGASDRAIEALVGTYRNAWAA